jgi:D-alanyl-D-alanine endopeptidase (penicillin-binding protein 7)
VTDVPPALRSFRPRALPLQGLFLALLVFLAAGPAPARASDRLGLRSYAVLVVDRDTGEPLISKNADEVVPIASLTKLMTALVVLEGHPAMGETLEIDDADVDHEKHTHSRLSVGTRLPRSTMLLLALMSSENRAANALSRSYPGGRRAFIARMNSRARELGMSSTHFADPAGLSDDTTSTARDLLRLMNAASAQSVIRNDSTHDEETVRVRNHLVKFISTNRMVRSGDDNWDIELQKTGFTNEAGRCLVMRANVLNRRLSMVFLNSAGTLTRFADARRVRDQIALHRLDQTRPKTADTALVKGTS